MFTKLNKLNEQFSLEIKKAFDEIKKEFIEYAILEEFPQLVTTHPHGEEYDLLNFRVIDNDYYIIAHRLITSHAMYFETHKVLTVPNSKERTDEVIPSMTVIYTWDGRNYPDGGFSLNIKFPQGLDKSTKPNILIGKEYVKEFWEYIKGIERAKLKSLTSFQPTPNC